MDPRLHVTVQPPASGGGRRVLIDGRDLGVAYRTADLLEFLRCAGLDRDRFDLNDEAQFDWREGGPEVWGIPPD
ncbi:hypothetical protein [Streptomyces sp. NPDC048650]|uniref:hypothetical protein n=1 Tax=unclassified Streptomyces TaxID=2593676 RepID=UPI00371C02C2